MVDQIPLRLPHDVFFGQAVKHLLPERFLVFLHVEETHPARSNQKWKGTQIPESLSREIQKLKINVYLGKLKWQMRIYTKTNQRVGWNM